MGFSGLVGDGQDRSYERNFRNTSVQTAEVYAWMENKIDIRRPRMPFARGIPYIPEDRKMRD